MPIKQDLLLYNKLWFANWPIVTNFLTSYIYLFTILFIEIQNCNICTVTVIRYLPLRSWLLRSQELLRFDDLYETQIRQVSDVSHSRQSLYFYFPLFF